VQKNYLKTPKPMKIIIYIFTISFLLVEQSFCQSDSLILTKLYKQKAGPLRDSAIINHINNAIETAPKAKIPVLIDSLKSIVEHSKWPKAKGFYNFIVGGTHLQNNEIYAAFNAFERSLVEFRNLKDDENTLRVDNRFIALLNWNMIENELQPQVQKKYINYMVEAIALAKVKKDTAVWANVEITLAGFYIFVQKNYKNCIFHAENVLQLVENKDRNEWFDYYYISLLGKNLSILNLDEARGIKLINDLKETCEKNIENPRAKYVITQLGTFTARYFLEKKDFKMALYFARIADKYRFFANFKYFENVLNKVLYNCYKAQNQPSEAFKYLELVKQYEDDGENKKLNENIAEWQLKYDDEKQKAIILQKENERSELIRNLLIFSLLAGLGLVYYIYSNNLKLEEKNKQLFNKNLEIEEALFRGQSIERKRISADLHDNLGAYATAIKADVEKITENDFAKNSGTLHNLQQHSEEIINSLRDTIWVLNKENITITSISDRLKNYVSKLQPSYANINIQINENIENDIKISSQKALNIFRILQEGINNALKHSYAKNLTINILSDIKLDLSLIDDGKGYHENKVIKGEGLYNMAMRAAEIGMKLSIDSSENMGTKVSLVD
jgi:signal transduction histidine kinase